MNQGKSKWLQVGLLTVPISGVLGAVVLLLRGPIVFPLTSSFDWIEIVSSTNFLLYQNLLIISYVLPFVGFLALHEYLRSDVRVAKSSFLGLIFTLWGTALALPASGIVSYVTSVAGNMGSTEQALVGQIVTDAITGSGMMTGIVAAICYTIGPILFGIAIWREGSISKTAAFLLAVHGLLLSFGFSFFPALVLGWVLLTISGVLISLNVRKVSLT